MFSKLFTIASLIILAVATPTPGGGSGSESCSTGPLQCCKSVQKASDPAVAKLLAGLGIVVQDANTMVGLTCSAISGVGVGSGSNCKANTVCCEDNSHGGAAAIGCVPVSL